MFGNYRLADLIAYRCANIDIRCREELSRNIIVSERDYVSALSTRIRDDLGIQDIYQSHSQTLRSQTENENGVDGIIVFRYRNFIKAGIFEAKRPQVTIPNYRWDYLSSRNISHFSEQINKQRVWQGQIAIWEMFFNEGSVGFQSPPYETFGSSCVWNRNAYNFLNSEGLIFNRWTTSNLKNLLAKDGVSFYNIIFDILSCKAGKRQKIDIENNSCTITSRLNDNFNMEIPLPIDFKINNDERIEQFLLKNNLTNYTFVDLSKVG